MAYQHVHHPVPGHAPHAVFRRYPRLHMADAARLDHHLLHGYRRGHPAGAPGAPPDEPGAAPDLALGRLHKLGDRVPAVPDRLHGRGPPYAVHGLRDHTRPALVERVRAADLVPVRQTDARPGHLAVTL